MSKNKQRQPSLCTDSVCQGVQILHVCLVSRATLGTVTPQEINGTRSTDCDVLCCCADVALYCSSRPAAVGGGGLGVWHIFAYMVRRPSDCPAASFPGKTNVTHKSFVLSVSMYCRNRARQWKRLSGVLQFHPSRRGAGKKQRLFFPIRKETDRGNGTARLYEAGSERNKNGVNFSKTKLLLFRILVRTTNT